MDYKEKYRLIVGSIVLVALLGVFGVPIVVVDALIGWLISSLIGVLTSGLVGELVENHFGDLLGKWFVNINIASLHFSISVLAVVTLIVNFLLF